MKKYSDLSNDNFRPCKTCGIKPIVFINISYYDMITCRCNCGKEKDYDTIPLAESEWNKDN